MTTLQGPCNKTCLYIRIFSSLISAPKIHFWSGNSSELQEAWFWSDRIGWSLTTLQPSLPLSLCCCGLAGSPSVTQAACYFRHTDPGLGWGMYSCLTYGWNQILISNNASPPIWHSPSHPRGEGAAELSQSTVSVLKASNHFQSEINTLLILRVLPRNFQCSGALSV